MTMIGFILFFIVGCLVGMMAENQNHKEQQIKRDKLRHPALGVNIEAEMARDGWKI
jgi:hypothetical protein